MSWLSRALHWAEHYCFGHAGMFDHVHMVSGSNS